MVTKPKPAPPPSGPSDPMETGEAGETTTEADATTAQVKIFFIDEDERTEVNIGFIGTLLVALNLLFMACGVVLDSMVAILIDNVYSVQWNLGS